MIFVANPDITTEISMASDGSTSHHSSITVSHVSDAIDLRGLKIAGTCIRVTMINENGDKATMLFPESAWKHHLDAWQQISNLDPIPDTYKKD